MPHQLDKSIVGNFSNLSHTIRDSDHLVHIYEDKNTLFDSVGDFVIPALTAKQGIVIIASAEHSRAFELLLERRALDVAKARYLGQLVFLDANETLNKIMTNGEVDFHKFNYIIGTVLTTMRLHYPNIRAYGEMVNILWNDGQHENAISLEYLWNDLAKRQKFSLLCSYKFIDKESSVKHPCFNHICDSHTHLITQKGELKISKQA